MPLGISSRIDVNTTVTPLPAPDAQFGSLMLLTLDDRIPDDDPYRVYYNINEVAEELPGGEDDVLTPLSSVSTQSPYTAGRVYEDALVYFSQQNANPQPLKVGKLVGERTGTLLLGGDTTSDEGTFSGLSSPALVVNGVSVSVVLTSLSTFDEITAAIQAALRAISTTAAVAAGLGSGNAPEVGMSDYGGSDRMYVKLGLDTDGNPYPVVLTGNIATAGKLVAASAPLAFEVLDEGFSTAASFGKAMNKIQEVNDDWFWVALDSKMEQDSGSAPRVTAFVEWVNAQSHNRKMGLVSVSDEKTTSYPEGQIYHTDETSTLASQLGTRASSNFVMLVRDDPPTGDEPNIAVAIGSKFSAVDLSGPGILPTANTMHLGSRVTPIVTVTNSGKDELDRKNVNIYTKIAGRDILLEGVTSNGSFIDREVWINWIRSEISKEVFNLLVTSPRVPLSASGLDSIKTVIERVCEHGVSNAGIAPGTLDLATRNTVAQITGNDSFDGHLPRGYLVHYAPLATLTDAYRAVRKAPDFHVWFKGSGAVHFGDIHLVFNPA